MTLVKAADADRFIARPDAAPLATLIFGPDAGLVSERAEALVRALTQDPDDAFAIIRLAGDELAADPARLVDEVQAIPMFGGRRVIWVRAGGRNFMPALELLLALPAADGRVVVEAGDLKRNAPLRSLFERARNAAALPCYADEKRDLDRLIDEEMRSSGLAISAEARAALMPFLGGDRRASRNELRKLALYAHGQREVGLDDIAAVVGDASATSLDQVLDACFAGQPTEVELLFGKAREAGATPGTVIAAALRHCAVLHRLSLDIAAGTRVADAVGNRTHFRRKPLWENALKRWDPARLAAALDDLGAAALRIRQMPALGEAQAHRVLMQLALGAARR